MVGGVPLVSSWGVKILLPCFMLFVPKVLSRGSTITPINPECNDDIIGTYKEIQSPNFPLPYPRDANCQWKINTNNTDKIKLTFMVFSLPIVNDGRGTEELLSYTTDPSLPDTIVTKGFSGLLNESYSFLYNSSVLWLRFRASLNATEIQKGEIRGFSIIYTTYSSTITCKDPGSPEHGRRNGDTFTLGSSVSYSCNPGYRLEGPNIAVCRIVTTFQTWSTLVPTCVPSCVLPRVPENVEMTGSNVSIGSVLSFSCIAPFVINGSSIITCITTTGGGGAWDGTIPKCYIPDCSKQIIFTQSTGILVNPSFPSPQGLLGGKQCRWRIEGDPDEVIQFNGDVTLPFDDDFSYIQFTDVGNSTTKPLRKVTGIDTIVNLTSTTNEVSVYYHGPNLTFEHNSFHISYRLINRSSISIPTTAEVTTATPTTTIINTLTTSATTHVQTTVTTTSTLTVSNTNATSTTPIILISSASTERPVTLGAVGQGDNNDSVKIAVGVLVPLFIICLIASFIFYKWYRRKYPVRMILGREFAKFENPDYLNRASTLSLVRDDADDYFSRATSKATSTVSLANHTAHDNLAFQHDKNNLNPSDDDYDIVKRKSFLFKSLEEHRDWMETGFASATSSQSSVFESVPTESDKASEISNNNSTSAKEQINVHRSQEELHNLKNSNQNFPKDTPIETILGQVKDRRSFTDDPTLGRQKDYDSVSLSKYRSQSADPISPTQVYTELQGQRPEEVVSLQSDHSVSSDSEPTVNISEEQLENNSDLPKNIRGDSDVSIVISDEIDLGVSPSIIIEQEQIQNSIRNKSPTSENEKMSENASIHSDSTDDSDNKDALLLANTEFSDSGSINDIHISVKPHSDSVASLRGGSDSNQSQNSSRHSSVVEFYNSAGVVPLYMPAHVYQDENFDSILSNDVFVSDINSQIDDKFGAVINEQSGNEEDDEDSHHSEIMSTIPNFERQSLPSTPEFKHKFTERTSSMSSESSNSSASSGSYHFTHSNSDIKQKGISENLQKTKEPDKHASESSSETDESSTSEDIDTDNNDNRVLTPNLVQHTDETGGFHNNPKEEQLEPTDTYTMTGPIHNPDQDLVSNVDGRATDNFSELRSPNNENGSMDQVLRKSVGPDTSFSPDSVSITSNTVSSTTSYSSDDEGVYVIDPEHTNLAPLDVDNVDFDNHDLMYGNPNPGDASIKGTTVDASSAGSGAPPTNIEGGASSVVIDIPNLSDTDSDNELFTDEDILMALQDSHLSDDEIDHIPTNSSEATPPRNISIQAHQFRFDDDDDDNDIDV